MTDTGESLNHTPVIINRHSEEVGVLCSLSMVFPTYWRVISARKQIIDPRNMIVHIDVNH